LVPERKTIQSRAAAPRGAPFTFALLLLVNGLGLRLRVRLKRRETRHCIERKEGGGRYEAVQYSTEV
jgi:hypothetical protein